jgi:hypothetical protein
LRADDFFADFFADELADFELFVVELLLPLEADPDDPVFGLNTWAPAGAVSPASTHATATQRIMA